MKNTHYKQRGIFVGKEIYFTGGLSARLPILKYCRNPTRLVLQGFLRYYTVMQAQDSPLDAGRRFSCARCSSCCRHESGFVYISRADLTKLCGYYTLDEARFIALYCRWVPYENGKLALCLKEKRNFDCIFYADKDEGCAVYDARPVQCVTYPFWTPLVNSAQTWNDEAERCPGMAQGLRGRGTLYDLERAELLAARYARNTPLIKLEM